MNEKVKRQITFRTTRAIQDHVFPGCVIGIVRKSGEKYIFPFGHFTYDQSSPLVKEDSIFDVATMTKTIPVACLALYLIDKGKLSYDDQIIQFIPEFAKGDVRKKQVLIKHLLTNTLYLDLPGLRNFKSLEPDQILSKVYTAKLKYPPGQVFVTSNPVGILLGFVIEKVTGKKLDQLADEVFFNPLKMNQTTFHLERLSKHRILPTEIDTQWRKRLIQGEVHDEITSALQKKYLVGCSGLFSTVPDTLIFLEMLLNNGKLNNKRFFSGSMITQMQIDQQKGIRDFRGLGWIRNSTQGLGQSFPSGTLYRGGFTGCLALFNIKHEVGIALFTNRTYPKRSNPDSLDLFRNKIAKIIFANL